MTPISCADTMLPTCMNEQDDSELLESGKIFCKKCWQKIETKFVLIIIKMQKFVTS